MYDGGFVREKGDEVGVFFSPLVRFFFPFFLSTAFILIPSVVQFQNTLAVSPRLLTVRGSGG